MGVVSVDAVLAVGGAVVSCLIEDGVAHVEMCSLGGGGDVGGGGGIPVWASLDAWGRKGGDVAPPPTTSSHPETDTVSSVSPARLRAVQRTRHQHPHRRRQPHGGAHRLSSCFRPTPPSQPCHRSDNYKMKNTQDQVDEVSL